MRNIECAASARTGRSGGAAEKRRSLLKYLIAPIRPAWEPLTRELSRFDFLAFAVTLLLLATGVVFIRSTGSQVGSESAMGFWQKQLIWIAVGLIGYFVLARVDYRKLVPWSAVFYLLMLALLLTVLIFGKKVNGATSWLDLKLFQLQPSEFAKLAVILLMAALHSNSLFKIRKTGHVLLSIAVLALPIALIASEPDFGSAVVLMPIGMVMIFAAGLNRRLILTALVLLTVVAGTLIANEILEVRPLLKDYQRERILVFLNPERDLARRGYNAYQSKLAVGSGGWLGKGIGQGTQNLLGFLPQSVSNNDFIFSVLAEETGFLGAMLLLTGYIILLYTILRTAFLSQDPFAQQIGLGFATLLFVHLFINIGMSVGLTPITGLPLPLLSYGGSFAVSVLLGLGLMQSIYRRNRIIQEKER